MVLNIAATVLLSYLLGSVNPAIIIAKYAAGGDIREYGSGNAGATNALRMLGARTALFVFLGDGLKGVIAVLIGMALMGTDGAYLAGLAAVVGHIFPVYYKFKGGRGVSTAAAVALCWNGWLFVALIAVFAIVTLLSKLVSLASVLAALALLLYSLFFMEPLFHMLCGLIASTLIIAKHWPNLVRIANGTESKLSFKRKTDGQ